MHKKHSIGVRDLCLWHGNKLLFQHLNWSLPLNQWTCLMGQSGIGKSSLLRLLAGILNENARIQGQVTPPVKLAYLGQYDALLPWLNVFDNATLSARLGAYSAHEKEQIKIRAHELLHQTGLESAAALYPSELSGGMRQRLALVRALAENTEVILMDEPFSHLDAISRHQLQDLAAQLLKDKTVLFVTHDPHEALRLADRIDLLAGHPVQIENFAAFTTSGPREISSPELITLQKNLFQVLSDNHSTNPNLGSRPQLRVLTS